MSDLLPTFYAPPERDSPETLKADLRRLESVGAFHMILDALPDTALVLNDKRQIVFANEKTLASLGVDIDNLVGFRPGEVLGCIHSKDTPAGCGTGPTCRYCRVVNAILEAQEAETRISRDCRITVEKNGRLESLDLMVSGKKISDGINTWTIITMSDISDSKRRKVLERIFFHDVINSIASVRSGALLLKAEAGTIGDEYIRHMLSLTEALLEEVLRQRDFLAMERGDLAVETKSVSNVRILEAVVDSFRTGELAKGKTLDFVGTNPKEENPIEENPNGEHSNPREAPPVNVESRAVGFETDPVLLRRTLVNMVKNALEASSPGDTVRVETAVEGDTVLFRVRNPSVMSEDVRMQVFQRSFSTKGTGRGLGTYSMRMLVRDYLKGDVDFVSVEGEGTTFTARLPLKYPH